MCEGGHKFNFLLPIQIIRPPQYSTPIFLDCFNFPLSFIISQFCMSVNIPEIRYLWNHLSYRIYCSGMHLDVGRIVRQLWSPRSEVIRIQNKDLILVTLK